MLDPERYPVPMRPVAATCSRAIRDPDVILIGTGSEVHVALAAHGLLSGRGVPSRVVSLPSWELFEEQPESYRADVLPPEIEARVSVEAAATWAGSATSGCGGRSLASTASAPRRQGATVLEHLGFTAERVADEAERVLQAASIPSGGQRGDSES